MRIIDHHEVTSQRHYINLSAWIGLGRGDKVELVLKITVPNENNLLGMDKWEKAIVDYNPRSRKSLKRAIIGFLAKGSRHDDPDIKKRNDIFR